MNNSQERKIISLKELLDKKNLQIPEYQRPYEWKKNNILTLLLDIEEGINTYSEYRIGTIILCKNNNKLDIVDGQQRIISICLILKALDENKNLQFLDTEIPYSEETNNNIIDNFNFIKKKIKLMSEKRIKKLKDEIYTHVKFGIIVIDNMNHAFQLFDSYNSTGKNLEPTDLLKAYHLREIDNTEKIKEKIKQWEENENKYFKICPKTLEKQHDKDNIEEYDDNKIVSLFKYFLFPISKWSINQKDTNTFTKDDIYLYKGINENNNYDIVYNQFYKNTKKTRFNINKPFISGIDFFNMVNNYINKIDKLIENKNIYQKLEYDKHSSYKVNGEEKNYIKSWNKDIGTFYVRKMYYAALLYLEDKFKQNNNYQSDYIEDVILNWAVKARIMYSQINYKTINHYILNNEDKFNPFYEIANARSIEELESKEINLENIKISRSRLETFRKAVYKSIKDKGEA